MHGAPKQGRAFVTGVSKSLHHDSAVLHVSGRAHYADDIPEPKRLLHVIVAKSEHADATLLSLELDAVRAAPGVAIALSAADVLGENDISPHSHDEPALAEKSVIYIGQPLFAVAAETRALAIAAANLATIKYADRAPILSMDDARAAAADLESEQVMARGDLAAVRSQAAGHAKGRLRVGGQDHFYLEGQVCVVTPLDDGDLHVLSSTQNPTEVQNIIARVTGRPASAITVEVRRMGGGFGGKETQPATYAAIAALVALKTRRPVKLRLDRDDDMIMTGKRHDFEIDYDVGYDAQGQIRGAEIAFASRCGCSADLSLAVNDRAMFHADNAYYLDAARITSRRFKTNTASNTAFRGFGGPQGMIAIEHVLDVIALQLGRDPLDIRKANLYGGEGRNITQYYQTVEDNILPELIEALESRAHYRERRATIRSQNANDLYLKRGIALTPVKFGISFTAKHLNQAGALIHIYSDGSIHLNHGGTEMGQGLNIKVAQVVAEEFQVDLDCIKITATTTGKVPNTSPTAASAGSDLNGMAAQAAARTLKDRLADYAAELFSCGTDQIVFRDNHVQAGNHRCSFAELVHGAYMARISLSATGFYKTPLIHYDRKTHRGRPFYYYSYGAAVSEVELDTLTGESRVTRVDILHDVGKSLNPAIDLGQIEGGFIQGMGWLTTEELVYDAKGRLLTHAPSTYKIPTSRDRPPVFNVSIWEDGENREQTIYRSKAVGEPPLMLAISVFSALFDAVASVADYRLVPNLDAPATPERLFMAMRNLEARAAKRPRA